MSPGVFRTPITESINNDSTSHCSMDERNAKTGSSGGWGKSSVILALIFVLQTMVPAAISEGSDDGLEICGNPSNVLVFWLGGFCDSRFDVHDGTDDITSWVEGMYNFNMTSPSEIEFQASLAIREWDRTGLGIFDGMGTVLQYDNINTDDGLPADVLRAAFDNNTDPNDATSPTIKDTLLDEVNGSVTDFLSGWGGSSTPETSWATSIFLPDEDGNLSAVDCSIDPNENDNGNAFDPPICISTSVNISLPISGTYGSTLSGVNAEKLNTALEGLLVMGAEVTTKFDVSVEPGHMGTYSIHPPDYATVVRAGGYIGEEVPQDGGYNTALWVVDNRQDPDDIAPLALGADLNLRLGYRQTVNTAVANVAPDDKSLDLKVTIDMSDENSAFVEVSAGIYQIQTSSLDRWGVPPLMSKDKADIPFITADGIRMGYHNGLLDLRDLSNKLPISDIGEAIGNSNNGLNIQMGTVEWTHVSQAPLDPGGLNYTHGDLCNRGVHFCLEGTVAMEDLYPVYLKSVSHTFPMSLADLLGGNLGEGVGFMNSVTGDDLQKLLNSGVEFSTVLSDETMESFIGDMLPSGMSADLTMEIVLPEWASTTGGGDRIELAYKVSGQHDSEISLAGSDSFSWNHAICSNSTGVACQDGISPDQVCGSSQKTCAYVEVDLDLGDFSVANLPVTKGVTVEFGLSINLTVHRIAVPDSVFESLNTETTSLGLEVLPADLLRLILDIGARGDPLEIEFSICDSGKSYCNQKMPISSHNQTGLSGFGEDLSRDLKSYMSDESSKLSSEEDSVLGNVDLSAFFINIAFPQEGLVDDDQLIGDEKGIVMSLEIPSVRFTIGLENSWGELISLAQGGEGGPQIGIATEAGTNALVAPFLNPMVSAMSGLTDALSSSLVSAEGIRPPGELGADVPASILSDIGPDELEIDLGGVVTLTLPLGVELQNLSAEKGVVVSSFDSDSRQVITYQIAQGMGDDRLEFELLLTPMWILTQLQFYIMGIIVFFLWRTRRRTAKRKKRRRAAALEALEESASNPIGYVAPIPTVEVLEVAENGIVIKKRLTSV